MSEFLEPPPLRRTVSTPSADLHHLSTYFDPSTPLSGVPEDNENDTVTPNMIFLGANGSNHADMDMPPTALDRSYSVPYYAAIQQQQQQQQQQHYHQHHGVNQNYMLTPGASMSPYQQNAKARTIYTPMQANGLMTPMTSSNHAMRSHSSSAISTGSASANANANAFLTPMTPSNTVPTFKDHTGVKLEFDTARSTPVSNSQGVNPFYSPPSYMTSMTPASTTPSSTYTSMLNDRKLQVANAAAQALDVRSFTPPEYATASSMASDASTGPSMIPSPASSAEYHDFLDSVHVGGKMPHIVRPKPQGLSSHGGAFYGLGSTPPRMIPSSPTPLGLGEKKPHRCDDCMKSFKRLEHLKRHMRIHTAERPFICDVAACHRRFSRSDNLRAHRRTHMRKGGRNKFIEDLSDV